MAKAQKRNAAYFKGRLINEFPQAYTDFLAGRYSSITSACKAVGLMSADSPLKALKRSWSNASGAEKKQFLAWIRARSPTAAIAPLPVAALPPAIVGGNVQPWAAKRIREIMDRRGISESDVMDDLGFPRLNASLWSAIRAGGTPRRLKDPKLIVAVEQWLTDNRGV